MRQPFGNTNGSIAQETFRISRNHTTCLSGAYNLVKAEACSFRLHCSSLPELSQIFSLLFSSFLQKGLIIISLHTSNLFSLWCYHFIFAEFTIFKMYAVKVWATFVNNIYYFISVILKSHTRHLTLRCFSCLSVYLMNTSSWGPTCKWQLETEWTMWSAFPWVVTAVFTALSHLHNSATEPKTWIRTPFCDANNKVRTTSLSYLWMQT